MELVHDLPPASLISQLQRVASMSCLLLSHLAWDNPKTQSYICEDDRLMQLFHLIDVGHDFQRILLKIKTFGQSLPSAIGLKDLNSGGANTNANFSGLFSLDEDCGKR